MADDEGIRSPFPTQPSARSSKLCIYESLFLFNQCVDQLVALLRWMTNLSSADKDSMDCAIFEVEEVRCDLNADFTEQLADSERFDAGHFAQRLRVLEKQWCDPDDVYVEVERREAERVQQGLPRRVLGNILPRSAVAHAEERWGAEQEHKRKHATKLQKLALRAKDSAGEEP
jgi:hypothetical protein